MELNPAQQHVIDLLGKPLDERPAFSVNLAQELRTYLEHELSALMESFHTDYAANRPPNTNYPPNTNFATNTHTTTRTNKLFLSKSIFLSKSTLSKVLGCERNFMAEKAQPFRWTPSLARGTISHKAVELSLQNMSETTPLAMVDKAMARVAELDHKLGEYLRTCSDVEQAELRAEANERLVKFLESFPPIKKEWIPVTESSIRAQLVNGAVTLSGKPDLTLGKARGNVAGKMTAGKVIIDFKSGGFSHNHSEELRFYALIETLRLGVPPRTTATCYLDSGDVEHETITRESLESISRKIILCARNYLELTTGQREPSTSPSYMCRWCPVQTDCVEGTEHINSTGSGL